MVHKLVILFCLGLCSQAHSTPTPSLFRFTYVHLGSPTAVLKGGGSNMTTPPYPPNNTLLMYYIIGGSSHITGGVVAGLLFFVVKMSNMQSDNPPDKEAANMEVYAWAESSSMLFRPCVDCGRYTGNFCENDCKAAIWVPAEQWASGQLTPHCTSCERKSVVCHFCRGVRWCTPFPFPRNAPARLEASCIGE